MKFALLSLLKEAKERLNHLNLIEYLMLKCKCQWIYSIEIFKHEAWEFTGFQFYFEFSGSIHFLMPSCKNHSFCLLSHNQTEKIKCPLFKKSLFDLKMVRVKNWDEWLKLWKMVEMRIAILAGLRQTIESWSFQVVKLVISK